MLNLRVVVETTQDIESNAVVVNVTVSGSEPILLPVEDTQIQPV